MGYQEDRTRRMDIFEDTIRWCEGNRYLLGAVVQTRKNTVLYKNPLVNCDQRQDRYTEPCQIYVSRRRILETAQDLCRRYPGRRVGILNAASATNPGGGVIRGRNAQEECLCICSTLYPCLNTKRLLQGYYNDHQRRNDSLYTDACIYTPGIIGIKTDTRWPERMEESEWFTVDVISCAEPDLREGSFEAAAVGGRILITEDEKKELLYSRVKGILQLAMENRIDVLVLGAFGCGTFGNSPEMAAEVFQKVLKEYQYSFRTIEFAMCCASKDMINYDIFLPV